MQHIEGEQETAVNAGSEAAAEREARRHQPWTEVDIADLSKRLRVLEPNMRRLIREERERLGWSQARFARELELIGVRLDPTAITRIESGKRAVRAEEVWAIAAALRRSVSSFIPDYAPTVSIAERLDWARRDLEDKERVVDLHRSELDEKRGVVAALARMLDDESDES